MNCSVFQIIHHTDSYPVVKTINGKLGTIDFNGKLSAIIKPPRFYLSTQVTVSKRGKYKPRRHVIPKDYLSSFPFRSTQGLLIQNNEFFRLTEGGKTKRL